MDTLIFKNLLENQLYVKKVIHHLQPEYFESSNDKLLFKMIKGYINKYSTEHLPTSTVLNLSLSKTKKISEYEISGIIARIKEIEEIKKEEHDLQWLIDETEDFCKSKAMTNAIIKSVDVLQNDKNLITISELVKEALRVSFESDLGVNFFDKKDIDKRLEYYNRKILKIPCKLKELNNSFSGGFESKTLSVVMGSQHSGKCISEFSSIVKIRNKKTGKIEKITIKELIKKCKN